MTVTTSNYTSTGATKKIQITGEITSTNVISAVNSAITSSPIGGASSWVLYDTLEGNPPGTGTSGSAFSPINTYVFRSPLFSDASTYKFLIMRWDIIQRYFWTSTCESWSLSTHLPTNETWTNSGAFFHGYDLQNGFILVNGSARHITLWSWIAEKPGMWSLVTEIQPLSSDDTIATNTSWAWTCSLMIGTPFGATSNTATSRIMFATPRAPTNATGAAAAQVLAPCTVRGMFPPLYPLPSGATGPTITVDTNLLHLGSAYNQSSSWSSTQDPCFAVSIEATISGYPGVSFPKGNLYSVGITGTNKLTGGETLSVTLDSDGGWPSASGSTTAALALPLNGGYDNDLGYGANRCTVVTGNTYSVKVNKICPIGNLRTVLAASDGVRFWDAKLGAGSETVLVYSDSGGVYDVVFDGEYYVYASTSTGVIRIDVSNAWYSLWTTTSLAISGGCGYLNIDKKYLYATERTYRTLPVTMVVSRSTFTLTSTCTQGTTQVNAAPSTTPLPDYNGSFIVGAGGAAVGSAYTMRIAKFTSDTGVQTYNTADPARTGAVNYGFALMLDPTSGDIWYVHRTTSTSAVYLVSSSLTYTSFGSFTCDTNAPISYYPDGTSYKGDAQWVAIRGLWSAIHKSPGSAPGVSPPRGFTRNPASVAAAFTAVSSSTVSFGTRPTGGASSITTDGVYIYAATVGGATTQYVNLCYDLYTDKDSNGDSTGFLIVKG